MLCDDLTEYHRCGGTVSHKSSEMSSKQDNHDYLRTDRTLWVQFTMEEVLRKTHRGCHFVKKETRHPERKVGVYSIRERKEHRNTDGKGDGRCGKGDVKIEVSGQNIV